MKKKTTDSRAAAPAAKPPAISAGTAAEAAPAERRAPVPPVPPARAEKDRGSAVKLGIVVLLAVLVLCLAYYFFLRADAETFKDAFRAASTVYIVMDVRNVSDYLVSDGILQCGVDFAGSPGMGGKNATILSLTDDGGTEKGCIVADTVRYHPVSECLSWLNDGAVFYIKSGPGPVTYTRNSIIIPIGANYTGGGCGITGS